VRKTNTIPSKTLRGEMGFLPPPALRVYSFSCDLSGLGTKGATIAQNLSDTSQDFIFICFSPVIFVREKRTEKSRKCLVIYG
jgi:hypothetical protein